MLSRPSWTLLFMLPMGGMCACRNNLGDDYSALVRRCGELPFDNSGDAPLVQLVDDNGLPLGESELALTTVDVVTHVPGDAAATTVGPPVLVSPGGCVIGPAEDTLLRSRNHAHSRLGTPFKNQRRHRHPNDAFSIMG